MELESAARDPKPRAYSQVGSSALVQYAVWPAVLGSDSSEIPYTTAFVYSQRH